MASQKKKVVAEYYDRVYFARQKLFSKKIDGTPRKLVRCFSPCIVLIHLMIHFASKVPKVRINLRKVSMLTDQLGQFMIFWSTNIAMENPYCKGFGHLPSSKLTWQWKFIFSTRQYIFKWSVFPLLFLLC